MTLRALVTGGGGFIGAQLVRRLVHDGWDVSVVDNLVRGSRGRLADTEEAVRFHDIDVRDEDALTALAAGIDVVFHLAAVNGTENFYNHPELVLDVGIRGALAVTNACRRAGVLDLVVASSAEVYQEPSAIPTPEDVALMLPDSLNPRYSYGGSKIATELIAFNYGREHFQKVQVFRPHNVYGPDMGWKHVIPQLIGRIFASDRSTSPSRIPILGDGSATRSFCFVDDVVAGSLLMYDAGEDRQVFHIGNDAEVSVLELVTLLGELLEVDVAVESSSEPEGSTMRRCPDLSRMRRLGYEPRVDLVEGLSRTIEWYREHPEPPDGENLR